jgi:hypothetical protein
LTNFVRVRTRTSRDFATAQIGLRFAASVMHRRQQLSVRLPKPRQPLGVLLVVLAAALGNQLHSTWIPHRHLVTQLLEQLAQADE